MAPPTRIKLDSVFTHSPGFAIEYSERPGYSENYTLDGGEVRRILQCNWSDIRDFPIAVLGDVQPGAGGFLKRNLPHSINNSKRLRAVECNLMNGAGAWTKDLETGRIYFSDRINNLDGLAEWEVVYRQVTYDVLSDAQTKGSELERFVTRLPKFSLEVFNIPGEGFRWEQKAIEQDVTAQAKIERDDGIVAQAAGIFGAIGLGKLARRRVKVSEVIGTRKAAAAKEVNVNIPESQVKRRPLIEMRYTWHWVPEPIPQIFFKTDGPDDDAVIGRLNHAAFDVNGPYRQGFKRGHCLCGEPQFSDRLHTPAGTPVRNITIPIYFRSDSTWDQLWRQNTGRFEKIVPLNNGEPIFKYGNFDNIFRYL